MKLAIVGSRSFSDYDLLKKSICHHFDTKTISHIISGGAQGADTLAEQFANELSIPTIILKADWHSHGRSAGILRNRDIVNACDCCIAFWDGASKGTTSTINMCKAAAKKVIVIHYGNNPVQASLDI